MSTEKAPQSPGNLCPLQAKMVIGPRELSWMSPEWSQNPSQDIYTMTEASSIDQCRAQLSNSGFCQVLSICKSLLLAKYVSSLLRVNCSARFWSICERATRVTSAGKQPLPLFFTSLSLDDIWTALLWWLPESNSSKIRGHRDLFHFFLNLDLVS